MIEFEGFGLKNSEDNIIHKQPSTQPTIGGVVGSLMGMFGAKKGSSSWDRKSFQTEEQEALFKDTLGAYGNLDYKGAGDYKSGQKADELEGFKAQDFDSLRKLQDEGQLSVAGLDKLRNYRATAATQVNPDIQALRGLGDKAWSSGDAHLRDVTTRARKKLNEADIASRRGAGATGGTAATRLGAANIGDYGRTVGEASARVAEQTAYQRQQLAMQARMQAGQLGHGISQLGLQGLTTAQAGELGQLGLRAQDLSQRRGIHSGERQYMAQNELQRARFSEEQAQAQNLWYQRNAEQENTWNLQKLQQQGALSTARTFENIKNVKKGSSGLLGSAIGAAGAIGGAMIGGPVGAQIGGQLAGSVVGGMGYGDDGGGGQIGGMVGAGMNVAGGGFNPAGTGVTPTGPAGNTGSPPGGGFWNNMFGGGTPTVPAGGGRGSVLNFGPNVSPEMSGVYNTPDRYSTAQNAWNTGYMPHGGPEAYNLGYYGTQRGNTYGAQFRRMDGAS